MPVLVKAIADERLQGGGVYDLDPATGLIAAQAAVLLGRSKTRMDGDRRDGKPPASYLDGRKVWYPLGEVLAERARMQGITPEQAREAALKRVRKGEWTFNGFMANGALEDSWPIAAVRGIPMDFLATLAMDLEDDDLGTVQDMTLEDFLVERLEAGRRKRAEQSQQGLEAGTSQEAEPVKPIPCSRCGRVHEGQCRL